MQRMSAHWAQERIFHKYEICVKCAGEHDAKNCAKSRELSAKCSNCGEAYPSNYRGCLIAKILQGIKKEIVATTFTNDTALITTGKDPAVSTDKVQLRQIDY